MRRYETELLDYLRREESDILAGIRESGKFEKSTEQALEKALVSFGHQFRTSEGKTLLGGEDEQPMDEAEIRREQITVAKKS